MLHIIEPDQPAALQLAEQLNHSGYQSLIFEQPAAAHLAATQTAPAAILANIAFSADPLLARHTVAASSPDGNARNRLIFMAGESDFQTRLQAVRVADVQRVLQQLVLKAHRVSRAPRHACCHNRP